MQFKLASSKRPFFGSSLEMSLDPRPWIISSGHWFSFSILALFSSALASFSAYPPVKEKEPWPQQLQESILPAKQPQQNTCVSHPRVPVKVSHEFSLAWLGSQSFFFFSFQCDILILGLVIAVSSRYHTDCKLGRCCPNGKARCYSPKQEE